MLHLLNGIRVASFTSKLEKTTVLKCFLKYFELWIICTMSFYLIYNILFSISPVPVVCCFSTHSVLYLVLWQKCTIITLHQCSQSFARHGKKSHQILESNTAVPFRASRGPQTECSPCILFATCSAPQPTSRRHCCRDRDMNPGPASQHSEHSASPGQ